MQAIGLSSVAFLSALTGSWKQQLGVQQELLQDAGIPGGGLTCTATPATLYHLLALFLDFHFEGWQHAQESELRAKVEGKRKWKLANIFTQNGLFLLVAIAFFLKKTQLEKKRIQGANISQIRFWSVQTLYLGMSGHPRTVWTFATKNCKKADRASNG